MQPPKLRDLQFLYCLSRQPGLGSRYTRLAEETMRKIATILMAVALLIGCGSETIDKENAAEAIADTPEKEVVVSGEYTVTSESVLVTTIYYDDPNNIDGRVFMELKAGDRVRFTGRFVTFPTGLPGYEFEVVSIVYRDPEDDYVSNPGIGERCYLSKDEIIKNLVQAEVKE